jgi:predicted TIM-barrel fold metal-dependent hydrolase
MTRRAFVATTALTALATRIPGASAAALIDTNVTLGRWPFRRLPLDQTSALVAKLRAYGVTQAWAGSFDALLHKDISAMNARLAEACRAHGGGVLLPFGAINPSLPDWETDLRRCAEEHVMRGIRLHPNYHGYTLADPIAARVLALATERGLVVQIAVIMEEERTIHPLVNVPPTDCAPLPALIARVPGARVQLLNAFRTQRGKPLASLAAAGVHFEIATLEGVAGIERQLAEIPGMKLLFGSHAPFFYFESAKLKLRESALSAEQLRAISAERATAYLSPSR